ncbi:MAG: transketolase [Clostridiales bacterium]|nr:transketolase [Clostridiales bacterium]
MLTKEELLSELREKAREIRIRGLQLITKGKVGHPGATLSSADLVAALYFHFLRIDPQNPRWDGRDRLILSKGHGVPPFYVALAMRGFYSWDELYNTYRDVGSRFQGHPDMWKTPGIEISGGSLGQGLSVAVGMCIAAKADCKTHNVFCFMGDGECDEGQIWEAAMSAAHYRLDNLTGIIDRNKIQAKGFTSEIMDLEPFADKWKAFGWSVIEIDGHDMEEILDALYDATHLNSTGRPVVIIAHTIKGRGVSWMENTSAWHTHTPSPEQCERAVLELESVGKREYQWRK